MAVTNKYAKTVEDRVNALLAQGKIAEAERQAQNLAAGGRGAGAANTINRVNAAVEAAQVAADPFRGGRPQEFFSGTPQANQPGPGFAAPQQQQGPTAEDLYFEGLQRQAREGARSFLRSLLEQYGLGSLAGRIDELVGETTNELVIAERLRQTPEYRNRFKGLNALRERGTPDITNEADYLALESRYRQVFREAGLRDYLGPAGTQSEYDAIARLVGDFSVSVNEVQDRITDAQRVVANTPQEVRDALRDFYDIDPMTLTQYVLDPQRTSAEIQRRANAAIVGGFGRRAGLDIRKQQGVWESR